MSMWSVLVVDVEVDDVDVEDVQGDEFDKLEDVVDVGDVEVEGVIVYDVEWTM